MNHIMKTVLLIGGLALFGYGVVLVLPQNDMPSANVTPSASPSGEAARGRETAEATRGARKERMLALYSREIVPAIEAMHAANEEAMKRAIMRVHADFQTSHNGVEPFLDAITSLSEQGSMVKRGVQDLWNKYWRGETDSALLMEYVAGIFATHVISDAEMHRIVQQAISEYTSAVSENRNALMLRVESVVARHGMELSMHMDVQAMENLRHGARQQFDVSLREMAVDGMIITVSSFALGQVLEMAIQEVVSKAISAINTAAAATAMSSMAAGGTTAAFAAAGGAAGSVVPGLGTAVGLGLGLVIGMGVDYFMTEEFKDTKRPELHSYLDTLERLIVEGTASPGQSGGWKGLRARMHESNDAVRMATTRAYETALMAMAE